MRVGMTIFCQNAEDWDRYEAEERGEQVPDRPATSDRQIFLEDVSLAVQADSLGFDTVWTIEHHFTPYTMVTNPLQLLTYIAGVTKKVDLGTMVVVLPWHNPVRVAEDVVMLDALLGGRRVVLGVGRGLGRREFAGLNVDQNEARGRFDENIQVLRDLLRDGQIKSFDGQFYNIQDLRLRPQPAYDLSDNLYCAAGSPETMEVIANAGVKPMVIPNTDLETSLAGIRRYTELREQAGFGPVDTRLALWTYCAPTVDEARGPAEKYMACYADTALRHYELLGDHLSKLKGYEGYGQRSAAMRQDPGIFARGFTGGHPWGTPEMIIERSKQLAEAFGTSELTFVFRYGGMPLDLAQKSMELFAKEVLPELKKLNPAPLRSAAAAL
ncbi:MAG: LLM class flavin-dependent oxidoreductase [Dehalococcoidia bacterium]|nr:LLM class flavin-dependent oxidoreductase [Dehalococcoidia bacterium]MCB9485713.1 LLM class flavin-dependent oxidoreductase [Thermoflexaceae bacterium]